MRSEVANPLAFSSPPLPSAMTASIHNAISSFHCSFSVLADSVCGGRIFPGKPASAGPITVDLADILVRRKFRYNNLLYAAYHSGAECPIEQAKYFQYKGGQ